MNGFEKLKEEIKGQEDPALKQTVEYLLSRDDMESKYLNEGKNLKDMCKFIQEKARKHMNNGWNYVTNEIVYAWAIMYFSLPNALLNITSTQHKKVNKTSEKPLDKSNKNNVISMQEAKKEVEKLKEEKIAQLSLFGGIRNE